MESNESAFLNSEIVQWALSTAKASESQVKDCSILLSLACELSGQYDKCKMNTEDEDIQLVRFNNLMTWVQCMKTFIEIQINEYMVGPFPDLHCISVNYPDDFSLCEYAECFYICLYGFESQSPNRPILKCLFASKIAGDPDGSILALLNEQNFYRYQELMLEKHRRARNASHSARAIQQMESEIEEKQNALLNSSIQIEKLEEKLAKTEYELVEFGDQTERLRRQSEEFDALSEKAVKVYHLEAKLSRLQNLLGQNEELMKQVNDLKDKISIKSRENENLKSRVTDLLSHIKSRSATDVECVILRKRVDKLEAALKDKSRALALLVDQNRSLNVQQQQQNQGNNQFTDNTSMLYMSLDEQVCELSISQKKKSMDHDKFYALSSSTTDSKVYEQLGCF